MRITFPAAGSKFDTGGEPTDRDLIAIREALVALVAKAPVPPRVFQPGQIELITSRLRTGEPATRIAPDFCADPEQIKAIGRQAGIMVH
jgi:hypothetical protein